MPVQYVLGEWDFQDLTLKMKPPVFIPRPETEASPPKAKDFKLFFMCHFAARAHMHLCFEGATLQDGQKESFFSMLPKSRE